jgi:uncharacterized protein
VNRRNRIIYLHGFNSSPRSIKGRQLAHAIAALPDDDRPDYFLPQLSPAPDEAIRTVRAWVERSTPEASSLTFIGSSLGGFYATWLAERYAAKAVAINPAIAPDIDLAPYVGRQRNLYTGEEYEFHAAYLDALAALRARRITRADRYVLLMQTGDEVIDYRAAVSFYAGAWQFVQGGGSHAFDDFETQIPAVLRFAGVGHERLPLPKGVDARLTSTLSTRTCRRPR